MKWRQLCIAVHTNAAQSRTVSLSAVAVRESSRTKKIFKSKLDEITLSQIQTEDGVTQHTSMQKKERVRQTVARAPRNARRVQKQKTEQPGTPRTWRVR